MANITESLYSMRILDELSLKGTAIHRIHPLAKLLTTIAYLVVIASFDRYEISRLFPLFFYPVIILALSDMPFMPILKRLLIVEPLIIGIGILNPLFDQEVVSLAGLAVSRGWITFFSIFFKCGLTVMAALILIATTGMDKIAYALRAIKVPRLFVFQLLLTYRYISVLMEEAGRIWNAYLLRAPGQKGVRLKAWGSLLGQMLLRTYDRALRVYEAMKLRGFKGEYCPGGVNKVTFLDMFYTVCWVTVFIACRLFDISALIGTAVTGVIK